MNQMMNRSPYNLVSAMEELTAALEGGVDLGPLQPHANEVFLFYWQYVVLFENITLNVFQFLMFQIRRNITRITIPLKITGKSTLEHSYRAAVRPAKWF